ncbi:hypothetical protein GDO78_012254 [Eleutherodactylus coqui]|uniref:Uncharacterized protein n=1 Tax=Eleutherodactylus coqui TaxID=57060 RepID=A0A8J6K5L0_ELECQ|nr:hypothetical protein GDO78_012254 [Eleutherodactylus coqui]
MAAHMCYNKPDGHCYICGYLHWSVDFCDQCGLMQYPDGNCSVSQCLLKRMLLQDLWPTLLTQLVVIPAVCDEGTAYTDEAQVSSNISLR